MMQKRTVLAALVILAMATAAFSLDLGLGIGTRPLLPSYGFDTYNQAFGYHFLLGVPLGKGLQVRCRVGGIGALASTVTLSNQEYVDSLRVTGFEANLGILALVPVTDGGLSFSIGASAGYAGANSIFGAEYGSIRTTYDGLATSISAGTCFRFSELVSASVEAEIAPASVLYVRYNYDGSTLRYIRTQLGSYVNPTLSISLLFTV